jgi:hypothetical protein
VLHRELASAMTAAKQADQEATPVTHRSRHHSPFHVGIVADEALVTLILLPRDVASMMVAYQNAPFLLTAANAGLDRLASRLDPNL